MKVKWPSRVWLFATSRTVAYQPGFSVHGIFQARVLEWVAISFSEGSSWPGSGPNPGLPHFILWATREVLYQFSSIRLFAIPWIVARQTSLSITISRSSPKLTSIESVMPSGHLILCHPLFLLPSIPHSIRVFSNESTHCMRWPKYWSFSFSIIPSKEHPGLISFRMDWLDLLAVHGTLKSLQHHSSKAWILQCSAFFTVQLSHPYMTTGKTIALTRWTFVGKDTFKINRK